MRETLLKGGRVQLRDDSREKDVDQSKEEVSVLYSRGREEGGRDEGREGEMKGGREGGMKGGKEGWREGGREG